MIKGTCQFGLVGKRVPCVLVFLSKQLPGVQRHAHTSIRALHLVGLALLVVISTWLAWCMTTGALAALSIDICFQNVSKVGFLVITFIAFMDIYLKFHFSFGNFVNSNSAPTTAAECACVLALSWTWACSESRETQSARGILKPFPAAFLAWRC